MAITVPVKIKSKNYPVVITHDDWNGIAARIARLARGGTIFVFAGRGLPIELVQKFRKILKARAAQGDVIWRIIPDGEKAKTLRHVGTLLDHLVTHDADGAALLVALGGGTVSDLIGLTAALYRRGVAWAAVPTTLLAQVDAAIGGKTAVNLRAGKNLAGVFHQPAAVFSDTAWLKTLSKRDWRCGLAEAVKTAIIGDEKLFRLLEKNPPTTLGKNQKTLAEIAWRCVRVKSKIVAKDERDAGVRNTLNLGHTIGHAIERIGGFQKWRHGEAVAIGLAFACRLANAKGLLSAALTARVIVLLREHGLTTELPQASKAIWRDALRADKKRDGETLRFLLPRKLGSVAVVSIPFDEVFAWLKV